jgi:hypothetical protein
MELHLPLSDIIDGIGLHHVWRLHTPQHRVRVNANVSERGQARRLCSGRYSRRLLSAA